MYWAIANTHTHSTHTSIHNHTFVKIKKVFKMCKEKVAEPSCTSDSRRAMVKKHQWIIEVHNGSAYQGLPVLAAFTTESPSVPDS